MDFLRDVISISIFRICYDHKYLLIIVLEKLHLTSNGWLINNRLSGRLWFSFLFIEVKIFNMGCVNYFSSIL